MSLSTYEEHLKSIMRALVYIEENLDEPLSLSVISKHCFISSFHFHRIFKALVGENVGEYIKRLRLEQAMGKLCYTEEKIIDISLDVGYETPSSFTKIFTKLIGMSPKKYRKKFKPLVESIIQKTKIENDDMQKPNIVQREDESVLFIRRVGEYETTPRKAFIELTKFIEGNNLRSKVKAIYGIPLDNPEITEKEKLRFDACVKIDGVKESGEVGRKTILGGRYALFDHFGEYEAVADVFEQIFSLWYPNSGETLDDKPIFCEYPNMDKSTPVEKKHTIIYIPLV